MKNISPLVSIIMPVYNAQRYISESIESVLAQSYENWELIIVDDGSTDETRAVIDVFNDKRIMVYSQENTGVSAARNRGLELARGEYITFLDADDVLPPDSLKSRSRYLDHHPDIGIVDGRIEVKDRGLHTLVRIYKPYYTGILLPRLTALDSKVFFNVCYMLRRELIDRTQFNINMTHAEDLLFYIQIAAKQHVKYGFVNTSVYWYRTGHESAMTNIEALQRGYLALIEQLKEVHGITFLQLYIFRLKVAKILFLSWLNRKKVNKALRSAFLCLL